MKQVVGSEQTDLLRRASLTAVLAGLGVTSVVGLGLYAIGDIAPWQARQLIEAILPTSRFLFSSIMTATATILALMLTLLTIAEGVDAEIERWHYKRIRQIAFFDMLLLLGSTCVLVFHTIPLQEVEGVPAWVYSAGYYALLGSAALMAGALVSVVVLLYLAIRDFIAILTPELEETTS